MRLSSDFLFHYKHDFSVIKLILQYGFRHNLWRESLPYHAAQQENFFCSFCDILPEQASFHQKVYGEYAIALKKEWGIQAGISPVRYVHEKSPGISDSYMALKNLFREADAHSDGMATRLQNYLLSSVLMDKGLLPNGDIRRTLDAAPLFSPLPGQMKAVEHIFNTFYASLSTDMQQQLLEYLNSMMSRVVQLHNELELRDAFVRAYVEDFTHPRSGSFPSKVLYDEREWRSKRFIEGSPDGSHVAKYQKAISDGFLPPEFNLTFDHDDVEWIIVRTDEEKRELLTLLSGTTCLVDAKIEPKITTFAALTSP